MLVKPKLPLTLIVVWLITINFISAFTWGFGPSTFIGLLILVGIAIKANQINFDIEQKSNSGTKFLLICFFLLVGYQILGLYLGLTIRPDYLVDIAENTHLAVNWLLQGENPYNHYAQVFVKDFSEAPNTEIIDGKVFIYGIEYKYGYPYFPVMAFAYIPIHLITDSFANIKITNFLLLSSQLFATRLLIKHFISDQVNAKACFFLAGIFLLGIVMLPVELYYYGITDILMATLILYCFVALVNQKYVLAGVLLGLAQACKLLPVPFLALIFLYAFWGRPILTKAVLAYVLTTVITVGPFVLMDWESFLTSTTLFYMSSHQNGDNSSLWFFLPSILKPLVLWAGPLLSALGAFVVMKRQENPILASMIAVFVSYAIFMAFSKMTHMNYLWSVYPLACVAISILLYLPKPLKDCEQPL